MQKKLAEQFAAEKLLEHKLTQKKWIFSWNTRKKAVGLCNYKRKIIFYSEEFFKISTEAQFKDVILHEIAHALVGPGNGHNEVWKKMCIKIGAKPERLCQGIKLVPYKYSAKCHYCYKKYGCYRKLKNMTARYCKEFPACTKKPLVFKEG